jgi:L-ribulose-5-phosphate 3-epimerase
MSHPFKIGVMNDSFRLPLREGLRKAALLGAAGVQAYAVEGEMAPEALDAAARRELRAFVEDLGLEFSALCGDLGGHGFERADENTEKIARSKRIVDLAVDLGAPVVTTHIGVVPEKRTDPAYAVMREACRELGAYAGARGIVFAIETGPEPAGTLRAFLGDVDSRGIGVNLDPANFVMVTREDPVSAVHVLGPHIVHTHAKDGVALAPCDPTEVYHAFAEGGIEGFDMGRLFNEVPLGEGEVDWDAYLQALASEGFAGYLTIEREVGDDPGEDIRAAVTFLAGRIERGPAR